MPSDPVRLCCGQHHLGPQCPDGRVMCQLCFERFPVEYLHVSEEGQLEDVCRWCALAEEQSASQS